MTDPKGDKMELIVIVTFICGFGVGWLWCYMTRPTRKEDFYNYGNPKFK
jgi:hypothetical protein